MHRNNRARRRRDVGRNGSGCYEFRLEIDVCEYRRCANDADARRRGDETARRNDDLVARSDPERAQRNFNRCRPVGDRNRAGGMKICCKFLLKSPDKRTGPLVDGAGTQHVDDIGKFVVGEHRPWRHGARANGAPSVECQLIGIRSHLTCSLRPLVQTEPLRVPEDSNELNYRVTYGFRRWMLNFTVV